MKKGKMVGAIALTAALAMGTMPAFAASASNDADQNPFSESGSTEIVAKVDNVDPQVRAQVPLKVTVVFGPTGGSPIQGPSSSSYAIENIGGGNIEVTEAELEGVHSTFTSQPVWKNSSDVWVTGTTTSGTPLSATSIMFTLKSYINKDTTANSEVYLTTSHKATDQKTTAADKYPLGGTASTWTGNIIEPGQTLNLELGGNVYAATTLQTGDWSDTLCNIKYTIAAA